MLLATPEQSTKSNEINSFGWLRQAAIKHAQTLLPDKVYERKTFSPRRPKRKMKKDEKSKRIRERLDLQLPVRVKGQETRDSEWVEMTRLTNVTPFGAGFTLSRPVDKGRLLHMTIPMPRQLRVFDHVEDQYRIWALVRFLRPFRKTNDVTTRFEVGAAFVGKRPPRSYEANPATRYEIARSIAESITLTENSDSLLGPANSVEHRGQTRHNIPVDIFMEALNEKGEPEVSENTVTENISRQGATIFTTLDVPIGRFVRLSSQQYNLTVYSAVRARSTGTDGIRRVHVEFIDREWPL